MDSRVRRQRRARTSPVVAGRQTTAIHTRFQTTDKSRPEIEKIGPGRYRWKAA